MKYGYGKWILAKYKFDQYFGMNDALKLWVSAWEKQGKKNLSPAAFQEFAQGVLTEIAEDKQVYLVVDDYKSIIRVLSQVQDLFKPKLSQAV